MSITTTESASIALTQLAGAVTAIYNADPKLFAKLKGKQDVLKILSDIRFEIAEIQAAIDSAMHFRK